MINWKLVAVQIDRWFLFLNFENEKYILLKRNKSGTVCSTNTRSTVLNGFVRQREFSQIVSNHFWLNFNLKMHKRISRLGFLSPFSSVKTRKVTLEVGENFSFADSSTTNLGWKSNLKNTKTKIGWKFVSVSSSDHHYILSIQNHSQYRIISQHVT